MIPLSVSSVTATCAAGDDVDTLRGSLREGKTGLGPCQLAWAPLPTFIGAVAGVEEAKLEGRLAPYSCRNHVIAYKALSDPHFSKAVQSAREKYGPSRIAVVIGTSTAGMLSTERAYENRSDDDGGLPRDYVTNVSYTHNLFSVTSFVQEFFDLSGPAMSVSTACSSSANAFSAAARYIEAGLCDAAVVGGCDSLCRTTLYGFSSLELVSEEPCRPFDVRRRGLSIGEAAAYALIEKKENADTDPLAHFIGYGETSDAYHMSSPHPEGKGAYTAMKEALTMAAIAPGDVGYINAHGTATPANDLAEGKAVYDLFGDTVPLSSTKGWTGHTLGAAGALEAVIALVALQEGFCPGSLNTEKVDPAIRARALLENEEKSLTFVMSNSFGFGGNNCSLLFEAVR